MSIKILNVISHLRKILCTTNSLHSLEDRFSGVKATCKCHIAFKKNSVYYKFFVWFRRHKKRSSSLTYFGPLRIIFLWIIKERWHVVIKLWLQTMNQVPGRDEGKKRNFKLLNVFIMNASKEKRSIKLQDSWNCSVTHMTTGNQIIFFKRRETSSPTPFLEMFNIGFQGTNTAT